MPTCSCGAPLSSTRCWAHPDDAEDVTAQVGPRHHPRGVAGPAARSRGRTGRGAGRGGANRALRGDRAAQGVGGVRTDGAALARTVGPRRRRRRTDRHRRGAPRGRSQGAAARDHRLEHHDGQPVRHARSGRALGLQDAHGRVRLVSAVQRARCRVRRRGGQDEGDARRGGLEGQRAEGLDERGPVLPPGSGDGSNRPRMRRSTRASPRWSSTCTRPASRYGRSARSPATRTSTRSSSTTSSFPDDDVVGVPERRLDRGALDARERAGFHRRQDRRTLPLHGLARPVEEQRRHGPGCGGARRRRRSPSSTR